LDATSPRIHAVVFDLGGVFFDWNPRYLYQKLISDVEQLEQFLSEICTPEWHRQHDLGRDVVESCKELALRFPEHAELIEAWATRDEEMVAGIFDDSVAILMDLRQRRVPCYALSNMGPEAFAYRLTRYPFLSEFDGLVISGLEGVAKPDEAIYRILLRRFHLEPGQTFFVDDRPENVIAGMRLGFDAYQFTSAAELRQSLVERGLLAARSSLREDQTRDELDGSG
jgi:2-haloacid dehalogenase